MSTALETLRPAAVTALNRPIHILPVPWRDPHTVSPRELAEYIGFLEKACADSPDSVDLRTCLGMAYAMNYEVYKSLDTFEAAIALDDLNFFAHLKHAELLYRLRALPRAEQATVRALNLAGNTWELSLARKQLQEIRALMRHATQRPEWTKPLGVPMMSLAALMAVVFLMMAVWK